MIKVTKLSQGTYGHSRQLGKALSSGKPIWKGKHFLNQISASIYTRLCSKGLCVLSHLDLTTALKHGYNFHPYFIDEECSSELTRLRVTLNKGSLLFWSICSIPHWSSWYFAMYRYASPIN